MTQKLLSLTLPGSTTIAPPPGIPDGGNLGGILNWVVIALGIVAVLAALFFLLWGGIKWITSGGDKEKVDSARGTITYAIIGLVIVILGYVIVSFIRNLLIGH
jgi:hypothetical protein